MEQNWRNMTPKALSDTLNYLKSIYQRYEEGYEFNVLERLMQAIMNQTVWQLEENLKYSQPTSDQMTFITQVIKDAPNHFTVLYAMQCIFKNDNLWIDQLAELNGV